jgi:hypothetical protein
LLTWPRSGMTRSGLAYELVTLALPTDEIAGSASPYLLPSPQSSESTPTEEYVEEVREHLTDPHKRLYLPGRKSHSQRTLSRIAPALLPTPGASDATGAEGETRDARRAAGKTGGPSLRDLPKLLPTPDTGESLTGHGRRGGKAGNGSQSGQDLERTVEEMKLLPTPVVTDSFGSRRSTAQTEEWASHPGTTLTDAIWETQGRTEDTQGKLLPTPTSRDHKGRNQRDDQTCLPGAVEKLLPTPVVGDAEGGRTSKGKDRPDEAGLAQTVKLLPTPTAQEENPGAGGELRAAVVHGETRRSESDTDTMGRPIRKGREEVPGWSGEPTSPRSDDGSPSSAETPPDQLTIAADSTPASPNGCSATPKDGSRSTE